MKAETNSKSYSYIVEKFGETTIINRYNWVLELINTYIKSCNIDNDVYVSTDILDHVIIDYYVDIDRLKRFQEIEYTNNTKIYAYLAYWLLRHKPIQIKNTESHDHIFINEQFVAEMIQSFLFDYPSTVIIKEEKEESIKDFLETLVYYFKYREYTAQSIELIILGFLAGAGLQYSYDYRE